ncbi:MAG: hypothetical protein CMH83_08180 [Nocardioides sp.]|nr:hypothetical protein [Nocardioides sp.]
MRPTRRRLLSAAVVLAVAAGPVAACSGDGSATYDPSSAGGTDDHYRVTDADLDAFAEVMAARGQALSDGDREAFLATVDPDAGRAFRARETNLFDNLQSLPVVSVAYDVGRSGLSPDEIDGDDPTGRVQVVEQVRLEDALSRPVGNQVGTTFVQREGTWYVGAEGDLPSSSAQDRPWYGGLVSWSRSGPVLLLADADAPSSQDAETLAPQVAEDLTGVADLLGQEAPPVLVDATSNGEASELSNASGEFAGAITRPLYAATADDLGREAGILVKLNPDYIDQLVADRRTMRHELTHVVLRRYSGRVPTWMSEGIAEYVGTYPATVADDEPAWSTYVDLEARRPVLVATGNWGRDPSGDYLLARAAAQYVVTRHGLDAYLDVMRTFARKAPLDTPDATSEVLQDVIGESGEEVGQGAYALLTDAGTAGS